MPDDINWDELSDSEFIETLAAYHELEDTATIRELIEAVQDEEVEDSEV